jgi:hypothetical protein
MKLVILESPYEGDVEKNTAYARACMLDSLRRGEAPMVSHLLYTQVLDDNNLAEKALGIEAGLEWGKVAELTVIYEDLGITARMTKAINRAIREGRRIEYRHLENIDVPIGERIWKTETR